MKMEYGLVFSAESVLDQSVVTGLHIYDDDSEKNYIMEIPEELTISEGKVVDDFNITEVDPSTLTIVKADVPLEAKVVDASVLEDIEITPGAGYVGFASVTINQVKLEEASVTPSENAQTLTPSQPNVGFSSVDVAAVNLTTLTVKSNTKNNQTKNPTEPAIGFSKVIVEKFDGESGSPESEYKNGDEILIKLPSKFEKLVGKLPEFNGYYKAIVSDNNVSYAAAQVVYADNTYGPRIPMFDLIGKVEIIPAN